MTRCKIDSHRDLVVWQKAMRLAADCCRKASGFPPAGFELARHVQRTAVSIPSNIAEGHELRIASFRHHLRIALGSVAELDTQLELAAVSASWRRRRTAKPQGELGEVRLMLRALEAALHRRMTATRSGEDR